MRAILNNRSTVEEVSQTELRLSSPDGDQLLFRRSPTGEIPAQPVNFITAPGSWHMAPTIDTQVNAHRSNTTRVGTRDGSCNGGPSTTTSTDHTQRTGNQTPAEFTANWIKQPTTPTHIATGSPIGALSSSPHWDCRFVCVSGVIVVIGWQRPGGRCSGWTVC